jgi:hypothetical protein
MADYSLMISDTERTELARLLKQSLGETRVEAHRTHTPGYREEVLKQEELLRGLLDKVQKLGA